MWNKTLPPKQNQTKSCKEFYIIINNSEKSDYNIDWQGCPQQVQQFSLLTSSRCGVWARDLAQGWNTGPAFTRSCIQSLKCKDQSKTTAKVHGLSIGVGEGVKSQLEVRLGCTLKIRIERGGGDRYVKQPQTTLPYLFLLHMSYLSRSENIRNIWDRRAGVGVRLKMGTAHCFPYTAFLFLDNSHVSQAILASKSPIAEDALWAPDLPAASSKTVESYGGLNKNDFHT